MDPQHSYFINPWRACARVIVVVLCVCVCVCVCLSVCLSIKSHLASGASIRPENAVMYSVSGRKKFVGFSVPELYTALPA